MTVYELKNSFQYAMHGLGAYKGLRQTNSIDAFEYWYKKGVKIFEIDMAKAEKGKYVAVAHDLKDWSLHRLELFNLPKESERTLRWFMHQRLFKVSTKGLKPFSLKEVVETVDKYQDIIFMFDLFGMFTEDDAKLFTNTLARIIGDRNNLWDRLLIEAYNVEMITGINEGDKKANIIFCSRYEENSNERTTISAQELLSKGVNFVSYPWCYSNKHNGEIKAYSDADITVFSRTKYNTKNSKLKKEGVSVNIIANRFDGVKIVYQFPLYMLTYINRLGIKIYLKLKWRTEL